MLSEKHYCHASTLTCIHSDMQTSQVGGHFAANSIPLATYSLLSAHGEAVTVDNSILVINLGTFETDLLLTLTHCHLDFNLCLSSYPSFSVL